MDIIGFILFCFVAYLVLSWLGDTFLYNGKFGQSFHRLLE
jgi:hypothetical protein